MVSNDFIINPYYEILPDYKIYPFSTQYLKKNRELLSSDSCDSYFDKRFYGRKYIYTQNGRSAINIALNYYGLCSDDYVTIFTTSGNFYISSCVTNEIEKFCKWSRNIEVNTKVIFVNHEFGYPYEQLSELQKYELPIIEDCAHSFFSTNIENSIGSIGDFVIYSFPKMFPIQLGGLLVSRYNDYLDKKNSINYATLNYIKKVISFYLKKKNKIIEKRLINYHIISEKFNKLGFEERFKLEKGIVPGVFMFKKTKEINIELSDLKIILYANGIQCSVFYGEDAFFIPCHQNLTLSDIDYFYEIILQYIK